MQHKKPIYFVLALFFIAACSPNEDVPQNVAGWAPVYQQHLPDENIKLIEPQPIHKGGKIYVKDNFLYQAEQGMGIHVFNIGNPGSPKRIGFIPIPGAQEISIRDRYLYTNNVNDLLILDISDLEHIHLVKKIEDAFHINESDLPPEPGYFECIDPSKGTVVGWERKTLRQPKCKY
jgi:hypothetical protein